MVLRYGRRKRTIPDPSLGIQTSEYGSAVEFPGGSIAHRCPHMFSGPGTYVNRVDESIVKRIVV